MKIILSWIACSISTVIARATVLCFTPTLHICHLVAALQKVHIRSLSRADYKFFSVLFRTEVNADVANTYFLHYESKLQINHNPHLWFSLYFLQVNCNQTHYKRRHKLKRNKIRPSSVRLFFRLAISCFKPLLSW